MRQASLKRVLGITLTLACAVTLVASPAAHGIAPEPDFVYRPIPDPPKPPIPPPWGFFEGPCGLAVDPAANFYISDHYHDSSVSVFSSSRQYLTQLTNVDPLSGPCGLALDSAGRLYVNSYHRSVLRYQVTPVPSKLTPPASFGTVQVIDTEHPTGVAVQTGTQTAYVNQRTQIAAYGPTGEPLEVSGEPLVIGQGSLGDGYGIAVSGYPATQGYLYVPDASDDTVKVYDPATDTDNPVAVIDGNETPNEGFVSLRDSAVAVDDVSGEIYVADNQQPLYTEYPEAVIYVFDSTGAYKGRLKYPIVDALPPGLAVDNSIEDTQGRVYVTSGNTEFAAVYAYPPGSATTTPGLCPPHAVDCTDGGGALGSALPQAQASGGGDRNAGTASLTHPLAAVTSARKATSVRKAARKAKRQRAKHRRNQRKVRGRGR